MSKCQLSPERRMLDLKSEVHERSRFYSQHLSLDFWFSRSIASDGNIGIIGILVHFEKTLLDQRIFVELGN